MSMPHDEQSHENANTFRAIIAEANAAQMPAATRARIIALAEFGAASADDLTDALDPCAPGAAKPLYPDIMAEHLAATHPNVVQFPRKGV